MTREPEDFCVGAFLWHPDDPEYLEEITDVSGGVIRVRYSHGDAYLAIHKLITLTDFRAGEFEEFIL